MCRLRASHRTRLAPPPHLNASAVIGSESPVSVASTVPPFASTSCASSPHGAASVRPSGDSRAAPPLKKGVSAVPGA
jgi:hypothetical protein